MSSGSGESSKRLGYCKSQLLAVLVGITAGMPAAEAGFVTSPWPIQQEADQLLRDLQRQATDPEALLERLQVFLSEHAEDTIASTDGRHLPAHRILAQAIDTYGLAELFARRFTGQAAEELQHSWPFDRTRLLQLATSYPHTPAAQQAWLQLANLAWDQGRLGDFRHYADFAPKQTGLAQRLSALEQLHQPNQPAVAIGPLPELGVVWRLPLETSVGSRNRHGQYVPQAAGGGLTITSLDGRTAAAANGRYALVFNPITGKRIGGLHRIGTDSLDPAQARPATDGRVVVVLGRSGVFHTLDCLDAGGRRLWRGNADHLAHQSACSGPVLVDGLCVVCTIGLDDDGISVRANGFDLHSGEVRWSTQIARIPGRLRDHDTRSPLATVVDGRILVVAQQGLVATLSPSGRLLQVQSYQRQSEHQLRVLLPRDRRISPRPSRLVQDKTQVVIAPADYQHLLRYDRQSQELQPYTGEGSTEPILDLIQGRLLLGGPFLRLVDLETGSLRWATAAPDGDTLHWAQVQGDHILAATDTNLFTVGTRDGSIREQSSNWPGGQVLGLAGSLVLGDRPGLLYAYGGLTDLLTRLQQRIIDAPNDPEPRLSLAALQAARGQVLPAVRRYRQALERGAESDAIDRALDLLREHLLLQAGSNTAPPLLQQLQGLVPYRPRIGFELAWWQGMHAWRQQQTAAALTAWQTIPDELDYQIRRDGSEVSLGYAAQALRRRLQQQPSLLVGTHTDAPVPGVSPGWRSELNGHGRLLYQDGLWYWHCQGLLQGIAARDGRVVWQHRGHPGNHPMLGMILHRPRQDAGGVPITVIPGSSAYLAGLRTDDVVLTLNDDPVHSGRDVVARVRDLRIGDRFHIRIRRGEETLDRSGILGSWPEEPCTANQRFLVTRNLHVQLSHSGDVNTSLDTNNQPTIRVYRRDGGTLAWQRAIATKQQAYLPHLTSDDLLLISDNNSLQAWDLRQQPPRRRWEQAGQGFELRDSQLLNDRYLLIRDEDHERLLIRRLSDGKAVLATPYHPGYQPLLAGEDGFLVDPSGHLRCLDLATGATRWQAGQTGLRVIAAGAQLCFTLDREQQLASWYRHNGRSHRRYGSWQRIIDNRVADDCLHLYATTDQGRDCWVGLDLANGNLLWQHPMPQAVELQSSLQADGKRVTGLLRSEQSQRMALSCDASGEIVSINPLEEEERLLLGGGQRFAVDQDTLRHLPWLAAKPPTPIPALIRPIDIGSWATTAEQLLSHLPWQSRPWGRFALITDSDFVLVAIDSSHEQALELRLERAIGPLASGNGVILIPPGEAAGLRDGDGDGSLTLLAEQRSSSQPGVRFLLLRALPLEQRHAPWSVYLAPKQDDQPVWWLRANWLRLEPSSG